MQLGEDGAGLFGEEDLPGAAIGGIAPALDHPRFLQPVDHPARGDRFDFEHFGELALIDALAAFEDLERAPLRSSGAGAARALVEATAHLARHIGEQEGEIFDHGCTHNKHSYQLQSATRLHCAVQRLRLRKAS